MSELYKRKRQFVRGPLRETILQANPDIEDIDYTKRAPDSPEIVTITYANGFVIRIDVTAGSYNAMIRDVLRKLD